MSRILVLAWGNPGRGDDGLGPSFAQAAQDVEHAPHTLTFATDFQLQPEHATDLVGQDAVLFVDASIDAAPPFAFAAVAAVRDRSFTSHAMSAAALLAAYRDAFGRPPPGFVLAIRGERFDLGAPMSEAAVRNLDAAVVFFRRLLDVESTAAWPGLVRARDCRVTAPDRALHFASDRER